MVVVDVVMVVVVEVFVVVVVLVVVDVVAAALVSSRIGSGMLSGGAEKGELYPRSLYKLRNFSRRVNISSSSLRNINELILSIIFLVLSL